MLISGYNLFKKFRFWHTIQLFVEKIYELFEEIIEIQWKHWLKTYVTTLFFVILLANISSRGVDIVRIVFTDVEWLSKVVVIPTTSIEFNAALAIVSILLMLKAQVTNIGLKKTFLEYFPLMGKEMITIKRNTMPKILYYILYVFVKIFDILISLFIGILDVIGLIAKVISLSARLYGNMISGWVLLTMLVIGIWSMTESILGYSFPILAPLLLYIQALLVVFIQAFVFPLLVAIFIKLVQTPDES